MPTTSLKLSDALKERVVQIAKAGGTNPHAFMVDAIERITLAAERRAAFVSDALVARDSAMKSATAYQSQDVHNYIESSLLGENPVRPSAVSWRE